MDPRKWTALGNAYYANARKVWKTLPEEKKLSYLPVARKYLRNLYNKPESISSEGYTTLVSDLYKKDLYDIISKLKKMPQEEAEKQMLFSAFANTSYTRMGRFLNSTNIAGVFGTGKAEGNRTEEQDIKEKMNDILQFLTLKQKNHIDPKDLFLNYIDAKNGKNPNLATRIKNVFGIDPESVTGHLKIDTMDFTDQIDQFFAGFRIGDEKQIEINKSGDEIFGNWRLAVDILHYMKVNLKTLTPSSTMTPKALKSLNDAASYSLDDQERSSETVWAAAFQVAENLLLIFKDFSKGAADVMEVVTKMLKSPKYLGKEFNETFGDDALDTPFSSLILSILNNESTIRKQGVNITTKGKERSAISRLKDEDEEETEIESNIPEVKKSGRGRKPGSKNKPKNESVFNALVSELIKE